MLPNIIKISFILLATLSLAVNSYRILGLFPHPGESHYHFFLPVMRALTERGHNLTVISHFPEKNPPANWRDLKLTGLPTMSNSVDLSVFATKPPFPEVLEFFMLYGWAQQSCENALNSSAIAKVLKEKEKYDLILMEQFNTDCMLGIAHILKAPVIGLASCALMPWQYDRFGNPHIPSYIPSLFGGYSEKMNYKERLYNFFMVHGMQALYTYFTNSMTNKQLRQRFGNDMPDIAELAKKTSMVFVNQHFSLSGSVPLAKTVIEIGGIHIQKPKLIEKPLLDLLDNAENGVIYISWGSMIRAETLPDEKREAILKALGRFPQYRVLWKWENETLPNQPENVFVRKWMPQRELLCHPKVKVFMTHAGLLGSSEAAYCGVPVIATPMYGDQFLNSAALKNRGMGTILNYENLNADTLYEALKTALEPSSLENARKVSYSFKNRLHGPSETAVFWAEYVAATGGAPLAHSHSIELSWFVYHSVDVYLTLLVGALVMTYSWIWFVRKLCRSGNSTKNAKLKAN